VLLADNVLWFSLALWLLAMAVSLVAVGFLLRSTGEASGNLLARTGTIGLSAQEQGRRSVVADRSQGFASTSTGMVGVEIGLT
jgi:hypothetical protein